MNKSFLYLFFLLTFLKSIKTYYISKYELDSIEKLSRSGSKIQVLKGKTNKTKCIAKQDLKINDTILTFEKSDVLTSETCYFPNKTGLIYNITYIVKDDIIEREEFILTSCLFYIIENYYNDTALKNINPKIKELVKSLPYKKYEFTQFNFTDEETNEYLISARNYYYEKAYHIELIGDLVFDEFSTNKTRYSLFGSLLYYIDQHSFFIEENIVLIPYFDICNIYPHYLTIPNNNFTNSTEIIEFEDQFIIRVKRPFSENEHFAFGYNHTYDNEEMLTKNGIIIKDNKYDTHRIMKKYTFEKNSTCESLLNFFKKYDLNLSDYYYTVEEQGHELFVEFDLKDETINPLISKFAFTYYNWYNTEFLKNKNPRLLHIYKQIFFFIVKLVYDDYLDIESKAEVNYMEYLFATQYEKDKRRKIFRKFNLEILNLMFKNINFVYSDLIRNSWKEIDNYKSKYIVIDPNTLVK